MTAQWRSLPLGEVIQLEYGKPLAAEDRSPTGRFPAYGANGEKDRTDRFYRDQASIIVGRKGAAGEITLTEEKYWPLDVTYFLEFDRLRYDLKFLYYLLLTLDLPTLAKGVKPGINRNEVYAIPVIVPELLEQRRIVAILDEAFEGIATAKGHAEKNLRNARQLFETLHQSVFANAGEGWIEQKLGDIASFRNGLNYTKQSKGQTVRIIGVKDFQNHFWAPIDDLDSVTLDGELSETDSLVEGDILSVRSNGNPALIGRCMLVGVLSGPVSHSGFTIRIRLHRSGALPQYVCQFLKSQEVRKKLVDGGNGANIKSLNQGTLSTVVVPLPPVEIQQKLIARIEAMSDETNRLADVATRKLAALDELKQSLLHQAFSGAL